MSVDGKIMRRARQRLEDRKRTAAEALTRRQQEAEQREPRIGALERALRETMLDTVRLTVEGGPDLPRRLGEIRERNLQLQEARIRAIVGAGFPADYLEEQPCCPVCRDTGLTPSGEVCRCLKQLYQEEQQKELSSLLKLGQETFDRFDLDWYSDKPDPDGVVPRTVMDLTYEACLRYAESFGGGNANLLLTGGTGLGKTFLSTCIAKVVSEKGYSVVYDTAGNVFSRYEEEHFNRTTEPEAVRADLRRYLACDLLILDDLGTELTTSFTVSALYSLLNGRLAAGRKTIVSTNLTPEELRGRYSQQIYSRVAGEYQILRFRGRDIRLAKKQKR